MEPVDVPVPELIPEGQNAEPLVAAQGGEVQPEQAEDFITYKYRDREVPLPLQAAEQIAQAIGWKGGAQALVNQLQIAQDAKEFYDGGRRYYQSINQAPQGPPQAYQAPAQYQRPQQYQQPVQPQVAEDGPDPIMLLQEIRRDQAAFREYVEQQRLERQQFEQQGTQRAEREAMAEHKRFADGLVSKGIPHDRVPDMWRMLTEANEIGLLSAGLPVSEVYNRVYRMNYADDLVQYGVQQHMNRLRDPKAQVTVPGPNAPAAPQPPKQTAETILGNTTWGDALQFIPEARR